MPDNNRYERGPRTGTRQPRSADPVRLHGAAAAIYPARTALVHGALRRSYAETYARCRRLAGALAGRGVGLGDTVSILAPNVPAMLEAHFGVPMAGAVLNALNIRLDAASIAGMLEHARSRVLIADAGFADVVGKRWRDWSIVRTWWRSTTLRKPRGGEGASPTRATRNCLPPGRPISRGPGPRTSGRRSRSTTPRAPPDGRRGSSITTGARI